MSDALEVARRALYEAENAQDAGQEMPTAAVIALIRMRMLIEEIDSGVWIDTRRIEALRTNDYSRVTITLLAPAFYGGKRPWQVTIGPRGIYGPAQGATLADALAAAEREAR